MRYWEIIAADNLSEAGWSCGHFVVRADGKLTAFMELESAIRTAFRKAETCRFF
jgi:hypothetical protein